MTMSIDAYQKSLRHVPPPHGGRTHSWKMSTANLAAWAGIPIEQAEGEMMAALGARDEDKRPGVRQALMKAYTEHGRQATFGFSLPAQKPKPKSCPSTVQNYIRRGTEIIGPELSAESYLQQHSPLPISGEPNWRNDSIVQLMSLFQSDETVWCGVCGKQSWKGGQNWGVALARDKWCDALDSGEEIPPLLCLNPVRPDYPRGPSKPPTASDIAVFRQTLFEMDAIPIEDQMRFLVGWRLKDFVSLTFSGRQSIHGVFPVNVADAAEWEAKVKRRLFPGVFVPYGADPACCDPNRKTRLGGAWRVDNKVPAGARQRLLFAREALP